MFELAKQHDKTGRNGPRIFVGDWAIWEGTAAPDFGAALGDVAILTGLERHSDVVEMLAYAPLFVKVNPGGMRWSLDLIGYNADHTVDSLLSGTGERFFYSVTASSNRFCMKLVNADPNGQRLSIAMNGPGWQPPRSCIPTTSCQYGPRPRPAVSAWSM